MKEPKTKNKDPLKLELKKGENLARELVLHLNRMGAGKAKIPVKLSGREYVIEIKTKE